MQREQAKPDGSRNLKKIRSLKIKLDKCARHDQQYQTQRSYIQAKIEALEPGSGEWVLYQDYLSWYSQSGHKMNNLLFTLVTRRADGHLQYEYIHNFITAEHTGGTSRYIWSYHMRSKEDGGSGELSSLPGPGTRTGDGGGDFMNYEFVFSESQYWELYKVDMQSDMLCAMHAWNPCDGAKKKHSHVFLKDQVELGYGFALVDDWLESAAAAGYDHNRYYAHDSDVISAWLEANPLAPRKLASWKFRDLRSFKYCKEALGGVGKEFQSGVAYASFTSGGQDADRIVTDMRQDKEAGRRCEACTQRVKQPQPAHKAGVKCPSRHGSGVRAAVVHVRSGATEGMSREEQVDYFKALANKRSKAKKKKKERFSDMKKADCVQLLKDLGLSTGGSMPELRKRLNAAMPGGAAVGEGGAEAKRGRGAQASAEKARKKRKAGEKRGKKEKPKKRARVRAEVGSGEADGSAVASSVVRAGARRSSRAKAQVSYQEHGEEENEEDSESDSSYDDPSRWVCEGCTFRNRASDQVCQLCGGSSSSDEYSHSEEGESEEED